MSMPDDEAITAALLAEPELAELMGAADVYAVGPRARGRAWATGAWDLLVLLGEDHDLPEKLTMPYAGDTAAALPARAESLDELVGRRRGDGGLAGVELELCGPTARAHREARDLAVWQFELSHARPLYAGWGGGDTYRGGVAARFTAGRVMLAHREYVQFRVSRNAAAGALGDGDLLAAALTSALAVRAALRSWLLWVGRPYPSDRWLRSVFAEDPRGDDVLASARLVVRDELAPADRFAALQRLWWLLDRHARGHGAPEELLTAWWTFPDLLEPPRQAGNRQAFGAVRS